MNHRLTQTYCETIIVTPQMAQAWLNQNHMDNRNVNQAYVERYARDMTAGNWAAGTPIFFSDRGRMIDGQHRLQAIVKSGVAIEFTVIRNVNEEAILALDSGYRRTTAQNLKMMGQQFSTRQIAVVNILGEISLDADFAPRVQQYSPAELTERCEWLKPDFDAVNVTLKQATSGACAALYLAHRINPEKAMEFAGQLSHGEGLKAKMPAYTLREYLRNGNNSAHHNKDRYELFLKTAAAIEKFFEGKQWGAVKQSQSAAKTLLSDSGWSQAWIAGAAQ